MNIKKQYRERRNEKVFTDFKKLYYNEIQIPAIYARLSDKYDVAPDTIARIVSKKRRESRKADKIVQPP